MQLLTRGSLIKVILTLNSNKILPALSKDPADTNALAESLQHVEAPKTASY